MWKLEKCFFGVLTVGLCVWSCAGKDTEEDNVDINADIGAVSDSDTDMDSDTDTDTDSDTDTDADSDSDSDSESGSEEIDPTEEFQQCLFENCGDKLADCLSDPECSGWLTCNQNCEVDVNDPVLCPSICGWYFQSPSIEPFATCIFEYECVVIEYPGIPECDPPEVLPNDLEGISGTWWLTRQVSEDYALVSDCQKIILEEVNPSEVNVISRAPLTVDGIERICQLEGTYRLSNDGTIRVEYTTSYVNYYEKWRLVHKSENALLIDICFVGDGVERKYGTWVYSRIPIEDFEADEFEALDKAAKNALGYGVADMAIVGMSDCPKGLITD